MEINDLTIYTLRIKLMQVIGEAGVPPTLAHLILKDLVVELEKISQQNIQSLIEKEKEKQDSEKVESKEEKKEGK